MIRLRFRYFVMKLMAHRFFMPSVNRETELHSNSWAAARFDEYFNLVTKNLAKQIEANQISTLIEIGTGNALVVDALLGKYSSKVQYVGYEIDKGLFEIASTKLRKYTGCKLSNALLDATDFAETEVGSALVFVRGVLGCMDRNLRKELLEQLVAISAQRYVICERVWFHEFERALDFNKNNVSVDFEELRKTFEGYECEIVRLNSHKQLAIYGSHYQLVFSKHGA